MKIDLTLPIIVLAYIGLVQFFPYSREVHNLFLIAASPIILYDFYRICKRSQFIRLGLYIALCMVHLYSYSILYEVSITSLVIYILAYTFSLFMWLWIIRRMWSN